MLNENIVLNMKTFAFIFLSIFNIKYNFGFSTNKLWWYLSIHIYRYNQRYARCQMDIDWILLWYSFLRRNSKALFIVCILVNIEIIRLSVNFCNTNKYAQVFSTGNWKAAILCTLRKHFYFILVLRNTCHCDYYSITTNAIFNGY